MPKKKASTKTAAKRRSANVPDSYRGFSVQATRFLYYLLKAEQDDIVSLEYFEDVGVEKADGSKVAEQDKSYLSSNPLTDRSVVFWKTFRNWIDAAQAGNLPPSQTHFVVYAPRARMGAAGSSAPRASAQAASERDTAEAQTNEHVLFHYDTTKPYRYNGVTQGFPPSPDRLVTLDTCERMPAQRVWALQKMRELCPTQLILRFSAKTA